jgi:hypothetical protein
LLFLKKPSNSARPDLSAMMMMTFRNFVRCVATAIVALLLANCAHQKPAVHIGKDGKPVNPYPLGSYEHFNLKTAVGKRMKRSKRVK